MKNATIDITTYDDEGEEVQHSLPAVYEICSRCHGHGTHVNPSIDGNGITQSEWEQDWDEESREMYFSGGYDVACEAGCENGKVLVIDYDRLSDDQKKLYDSWEQDQADAAREREWDRKTRWMEGGWADG